MGTAKNTNEGVFASFFKDTFPVHDKNWDFLNIEIAKKCPVGSINWAFYNLSIGNEIVLIASDTSEHFRKKKIVLSKNQNGSLDTNDSIETSAKFLYMFLGVIDNKEYELILCENEELEEEHECTGNIYTCQKCGFECFENQK